MELTSVLVFASAVALTLAVGSLAARSAVRRQLLKLSTGSRAVVAPERGSLLAEPEPRRLAKLFAAVAKSAGNPGARSLQSLEQRLVRAGYRRDSTAIVFTGFRLAGAVLLPFVVLISSAVWGLNDLRLAALLCAVAAVGYAAPSYWLDRRVAARQQKIVRGLPDVLDLMVVCVEAGLGINASLYRVAREMRVKNPLVSEELELVTLEIRTGRSMVEALHALSDRTGVGEVSSLVAMLAQTERFGTNVADALRIHADGMRVKRMQRAEEQAAKAPLQMLLPTLLIFTATMVVTLGPAYLQLMDFFESQK